MNDRKRIMDKQNQKKEKHSPFRSEGPNCVGKGFVRTNKVRVYHQLWGRLAPAKIKLNWDDADAIPFIYYYDVKYRLVFGNSDETHTNLFNKIEKSRFNYPEIEFKGRLWTKRKIVVLDNYDNEKRQSEYILLDDLSELMGHYIEDFDEYYLLFPESEDCDGKIFMNTVEELCAMCLHDFIQKNLRPCSFARSRIAERRDKS